MGEARAEQPRAAHAERFHRGRGRIGDVQQRDPHRGLDGGRHAVHRVRAHDEEVGAGGLERPGGPREQAPRAVPVARALQFLHLVEVEAREQDPRGVQAAEARGHRLVGDAEVGDGRLPAHAADHADGLHGERLPRIGGRVPGGLTAPLFRLI